MNGRWCIGIIKLCAVQFDESSHHVCVCGYFVSRFVNRMFEHHHFVLFASIICRWVCLWIYVENFRFSCFLNSPKTECRILNKQCSVRFFVELFLVHFLYIFFHSLSCSNMITDYCSEAATRRQHWANIKTE